MKNILFAIFLLLIPGLPVQAQLTAVDSSNVVVRFNYKPADLPGIVCLAGSFNQWGNENGTGVISNQAFAMKYNSATGEWVKAETLAVGIYEYAFVENGNIWRTDPLNPRVVQGTINVSALDVTSPMIFHLQPMDGSELSDETPDISAVLFTSIATTIDSTTLRLFIDGKEIAGANMNFERTTGMFFYKPTASLGRGEHTIKLEVQNNLGKYASASSHFGIGSPLVTRGPYLSIVTQNSIVVSWQTRIPTPSIVQYGTTTPAYGFSVIDTAKTTAHSLTLTGLTPSTLYHYRVISSDTTADYTFTTAVLPDEPFVFVAYGDTRTNHTAHVSVIQRMLEHKPRFVINTGDLVESSTESNWDSYFADICKTTTLGQTTPIYSALGNHEGNSPLYYEYLYLPHNNPANTEAYYSFDYGSVHFICLDTEIPYNVGSQQYAWLVSDLQSAAQAKFKFVFLHRPPYSSSQHGSDLNVRNTLSSVFESGKVDIVFCGHDHVYERTQKINSVTYIVTGGGGAPLYGFNATNSWTAYKESAYHFCKVLVDSNTCRMWMIRQDGAVKDSFTITKGAVRVKDGGQGALPFQPKLFQNYPNPFNPVTTLGYSLPASNFVSLKVLDVLGQEVKTLVQESKSSGVHEEKFDATGLASGVYFYRLIAVSLSHPVSLYQETKAMVLIR